MGAQGARRVVSRSDEGRSADWSNEVRLRGRVSGEPGPRVLPSGDELVTFRLVVPRREGGVDTIDCAVHAAGLRARALRLGDQEAIELKRQLAEQHEQARQQSLAELEKIRQEALRLQQSSQAEAERERRAKIIHAEGEYQAAQRLADAANVISQNPAALQLRYLQTLVEIAAEKNSTTIFPIPIDTLAPFIKGLVGDK